MIASGSWYTSGTFWAVAGVIVGVVGAAVALITWRIGAPRRLIIYTAPVTTSLLIRQPNGLGLATSDLVVTYQGQKIDNPYLVTLRVDSRSRRDIRSSDFDQGKPLVFDMDAPIKAVINSSGPTESPADVFSIEGNEIRLVPFLIRRGRIFQISLLTDGSPKLSCQSPLIDTTVKKDGTGRAWRPLIVGAVVGVIAALVSGAIFAAFQKSHQVIIGALIGGAIILVIALIGAIPAGLLTLRRRR